MQANQERPLLVSPAFGTRWLKRIGSSAAFASLLLAALWLTLPNQAAPHANAQTTNEATVIVQFDGQARVVRGVEFTTPISGLTALQWSGLRVVYSDTSFGPAVCAIEGVGCPATDCFCNNDKYWGYSYWDGASWQSYAVGAGTSVISQSGSIEGWRWGSFGDPVVEVSPTLAADAALTWLHGRQVSTDGGFGGAGASVEAMLALGANHESAAERRPASTSPSLASYFTLNGAAYTQAAAGAAGKSAVAISAADVCLPTGALTPQAYYSPTLSAYTEQVGPNSWAILGAIAVSESVPSDVIATLRDNALVEGGWEWAPGWGADTNSTALAIQALVAAGEPVSASSIISGLGFLASAQNEDGGFAYAPGPAATSDANSTAYVVQALITAGQDPSGSSWTISNTNPISYLLALQLPDGSFEWQAGTGSSQLATTQVIPALLGQAYPVRQQEIAACPVVHLPSLGK
ncbi:MAG: hypothetical protein IT328_13415 [Caldilineaceae bacterium]|nr:hypothetical protein [Caldilineaceae bacterium]